MIIRLTESDKGELFQVVKLFDNKGNLTDELWKATSCVVKLSEGHWCPAALDDIDIHTVH